MYKKFLLIGLFVCLKSFSQAYFPMDTTVTSEYKVFLDGFKARHELNLKKIKEEYSGKSRKEMTDIYVDAFNEHIKDFDKNEIYFEKNSSGYLNKLVENIVVSNPELKDVKLNVHFSRVGVPNAYSVGDGTLLVNMKFLDYVDSEAELTSVLCHEIAHYVLDHRGKSVKRNVGKMTSKEMKNKEKEVLKTKYGQHKMAEGLLKEVTYSRKKKSRIQELEADSLGFAFFKKTKFNSKYFTKMLKTLETVDVEKDSLTESDYREFFTTKNQKFIEEWLQKEDFSKYNYEKKNQNSWDVDSLKTHPDCVIRIKEIEKQLTEDNKGYFQIDSKYFTKLKADSKYEAISNLYYFKEYGLSLYETLKLAKVNKEDKFLKEMIFKNLEMLAKAKKEMKLNRYIPAINPRKQTDSYQRYINFMVNLSVNELTRISNDYKI